MLKTLPLLTIYLNDTVPIKYGSIEKSLWSFKRNRIAHITKFTHTRKSRNYPMKSLVTCRILLPVYFLPVVIFLANKLLFRQCCALTMDSQGRKVVVCDNGTGVCIWKIVWWIRWRLFLLFFSWKSFPGSLRGISISMTAFKCRYFWYGYALLA